MYRFVFRALFTRAIKKYARERDVPAQLLSNRSAAFAGLRQYDAALEDADNCIRAKPGWAKGYSRRGNALHGMLRHTEVLL